MSRKKILWLCSWYPNKLEPFNGDFIQRHAVAAAMYHDIYVIHVAGDATGGTRETENVILKNPGLTEQLIYYKKTNSFLSKFRNYYRWTAVYKKAIRHYLAENGKPDMLHVHVPMTAGLIANKMSKSYKIPYLVTEHWTIYQPQSEPTYARKGILFKSLLRLIVKHCRLLLPVSKDLGLLMNKLVVPKDFSVIENVANEKYFHYSESIQPAAPFRFLHVSNMTWQKNPEAIIECFSAVQKKFPGSELVIVGAYPPGIKQLIEDTGLLNKNIFLRGEVSYASVAKEMQQANALVMFSRFENSPCSIIEALCCGLPVIATSVGGIPELLDESNGLLIGSLDKDALLRSLETMIATYLQYDRNKIAEQAIKRFSYPVIGKKFDELYSTTTTEGRSAL